MLRRFGILCVLLLGLSGYHSSGWACAAMGENCCPAGAPPCGTQQMPSAAGLEQACCAGQIAAVQAFAAVSVHEQDALGAPSHSDPQASATEFRIATGARFYPILFSPKSHRAIEQQLLYLRT